MRAGAIENRAHDHRLLFRRIARSRFGVRRAHQRIVFSSADRPSEIGLRSGLAAACAGLARRPAAAVVPAADDRSGAWAAAAPTSRRAAAAARPAGAAEGSTGAPAAGATKEHQLAASAAKARLHDLRPAPCAGAAEPEQPSQRVVQIGQLLDQAELLLGAFADRVAVGARRDDVGRRCRSDAIARRPARAPARPDPRGPTCRATDCAGDGRSRSLSSSPAERPRRGSRRPSPGRCFGRRPRCHAHEARRTPRSMRRERRSRIRPRAPRHRAHAGRSFPLDWERTTQRRPRRRRQAGRPRPDRRLASRHRAKPAAATSASGRSL